MAAALPTTGKPDVPRQANPGGDRSARSVLGKLRAIVTMAACPPFSSPRETLQASGLT